MDYETQQIFRMLNLPVGDFGALEKYAEEKETLRDRLSVADQHVRDLTTAGNALAKRAFEEGIISHVEAWDSVARSLPNNSGQK